MLQSFGFSKEKTQSKEEMSHKILGWLNYSQKPVNVQQLLHVQVHWYKYTARLHSAVNLNVTLACIVVHKTLQFLTHLNNFALL